MPQRIKQPEYHRLIRNNPAMVAELSQLLWKLYWEVSHAMPCGIRGTLWEEGLELDLEVEKDSKIWTEMGSTLALSAWLHQRVHNNGYPWWHRECTRQKEDMLVLGKKPTEVKSIFMYSPKCRNFFSLKLIQKYLVQEYGGIKWMIHINHLLPLVAWYTEYPSTALTLNSSMGTVSNSNVHF